MQECFPTNIHPYTHARMPPHCDNICERMCIHSHMLVCSHTDVYTYQHQYIHACMISHRKNIRMYIHAAILTCIHININTCMHACFLTVRTFVPARRVLTASRCRLICVVLRYVFIWIFCKGTFDVYMSNVYVSHFNVSLQA